jgi:hypothetical protein
LGYQTLDSTTSTQWFTRRHSQQRRQESSFGGFTLFYFWVRFISLIINAAVLDTVYFSHCSEIALWAMVDVYIASTPAIRSEKVQVV